MTSNTADSRHRAARRLFVLTICTGSFLLFLVQPMIARMALPRLGGAPTVWNSAMLVYQALLLGGYAYAHWLGRFAPKKQGLIHLGLFAVAALMLPIGLTRALPPADANPFFWVPWLLLSSIGPLFFVVAAQAPLVQRWFALAGIGDPYPLYAASNLGSFGGLIAYPLLVEPNLSVAQQSLLWTAGYAVLLGLMLLCAIRIRNVGNLAEEANATVSEAPSAKTFALWVLLAAIPSGLMLSTSLHLTTDIVAMPLLWVFPLGLYLLSFSVAFAEGRRLVAFVQRITPFFLLGMACSISIDATRWPVSIALVSLSALFMVATSLHARMYESRPDPAHLTRFYLAMSVGGALGGVFCALIAPLIFDWTYEHVILVALAAFLLAPPAIFDWSRRFWADNPYAPRVARFAAAGLLLISLIGQGAFGIPDSAFIAGCVAIFCLLVGIAGMGNRLLFTASAMAAVLALGGWTKLALTASPGMMTRSFFGIYSIRKSPEVNMLVHGTTVHGVQNRGRASREIMHTTYYAPRSGIGLAMDAAPSLFGKGARIGVVGLGAGTLACYARPGQSWTFYEIDPAIAEIARDTSRFTFLSRCLPKAPIAIGDARLVLTKGAAHDTDLLAIDAFSSDAVPMHLLTKEAFETYRTRLTSEGLLMVHISNRYLDLEPVIAEVAKSGWTTAVREYNATSDERKLNYSPSLWIALSPSAKTIARLKEANPDEPWRALKGREGFVAWTDDFASILPVIKTYTRH